MTLFLALVQLLFSVIIGFYFLTQLRSQRENRRVQTVDSGRERLRLKRLREVSLTVPLSEKSRPARLEDIVGQQEGIRALKAALCGPNPQHVIIYGPPGVGKTCAARLVMDEARRQPASPFRPQSPFIEVDAACLRFDERMFADPLIGSVHDPIYQGAGAMGAAGIPQPREGAVTKAHGGILFLDEIGELPPGQMNKLLKVLEDRKVMLESVYYSPSNPAIPGFVHDIFTNGLPADFRLVGATTRSPQEIPEALRSRCMEVFFRPLTEGERRSVAESAARRAEMQMEEGCAATVARSAGNGREAVNMVQMACGVAITEGRQTVSGEDVRFVLSSSGRERPEDVQPTAQPGQVSGLAVSGANAGAILPIEAVLLPCAAGQGTLALQGAAQQEQSGHPGHSLIRKSTAMASAENACTVLRRLFSLPLEDYQVVINFPGGMPVDGPSAGLAMLAAILSAYMGEPVRGGCAMTGELSLTGAILPVGGVPAKVRCALEQGFTRVLIPAANASCADRPQTVPVAHVAEAVSLLFEPETASRFPLARPEALSAQGTV